MNRKIAIGTLAALAVATATLPASAQGGHRSYHDGWAWSGDREGRDGGFGIGVMIGPVAVGVGDYAYDEPGVGVSVGTGYDDWRYRSYAAAPSYGCSCANNYRSSAYAPRYRSSSYAWNGDYESRDYGYARGYDNGYASVGFGWSDDDRRSRRYSRGDYDRSYRSVSRSSTRVSARGGIDNGSRDVGNRRRINDRQMERTNMRATTTTTNARGTRESFGARMGANNENRGGTTMRSEGNQNMRSGARSTTGASGNVSGTVGAGNRNGVNGESGR